MNIIKHIALSLLALGLLGCGESNTSSGKFIPGMAVVTNEEGDMAVVRIYPNQAMKVRVQVATCSEEEERTIRPGEENRFECDSLSRGGYVAVVTFKNSAGAEEVWSVPIWVSSAGQSPKIQGAWASPWNSGALFKVVTDVDVWLSCQVRDDPGSSEFGRPVGYSLGDAKEANYCFAGGSQPGTNNYFLLTAKDEQTGAISFYRSTLTTQEESDPNDRTPPVIELERADSKGVEILSSEELSPNNIRNAIEMPRVSRVRNGFLWFTGKDSAGFHYQVEKPHRITLKGSVTVYVEARDKSGNVSTLKTTVDIP